MKYWSRSNALMDYSRLPILDKDYAFLSSHLTHNCTFLKKLLFRSQLTKSARNVQHFQTYFTAFFIFLQNIPLPIQKSHINNLYCLGKRKDLWRWPEIKYQTLFKVLPVRVWINYWVDLWKYISTQVISLQLNFDNFKFVGNYTIQLSMAADNWNNLEMFEILI